MANLIKGAHIVANIDPFGITEHHGVYVGDGWVIHLSGSEGEVVITTLESFSNGNEVRVKRHAPDPSSAVSLAQCQVGTQGYNLLSNNCEQFVNACIKGKSSSNQVSNGTHVTAHLVARGGLLGESAARVVAGPVAGVALASTVAKYAGEYVGLPDSVNTLIGTPGDFVAKPAEAAIKGAYQTLEEVYCDLCAGEFGDAAVDLVGGVANTAVAIVAAPFGVLGDAYDAIASWFD